LHATARFWPDAFRTIAPSLPVPTPAPAHIPIPRAFRDLPLFRRGCFDVFDGLVDPSLNGRLLSEAVRVSGAAMRSELAVSDGEEHRGGKPARRLLSAPGG